MPTDQHTAAGEAGVPEGWRNMDTAPTADGSKVLLLIEGDSEKFVVEAELMFGSRRIGADGSTTMLPPQWIIPYDVWGGNVMTSFAIAWMPHPGAAPPPPVNFGADSPSEAQDVHSWFQLSYSAYLVMPRLAMSAMPMEWQYQMTALLDQINERFPTPNGYTVLRRGGDGKIMHDPWSDYRRGDAVLLATPADGGGDA